MKGLTFDEESHTYTYNGEVLTSVTTFLSEFFQPFDAKTISKYKAMSCKAKGLPGKTPQYWLRRWKESAEHGSRVHKLIEDHLNYKKSDLSLVKPEDEAKYEQAIYYLFDLPLNINPELPNKQIKVISEKIVIAPSLGLAGTVDLIIKTPDGIHLIDWKTNSKIDKTAYMGRKCKDPVSHLPDCSYSKYTLQLQLYAFILEQLYDEKVLSCTLVHLMESSYTPYEIPVYYEDVYSVLRNRL